MDVKKVLGEFRVEIAKEIESYMDSKIVEYEEISPFVKQFVQNIKEYSLRDAKRLRAAFVFYTYKLFGGSDDKAIMELAVFIELMQSFLLIHDDIMDKDLTRRGGPTFHKIYEEKSSENHFTDKYHFGNTMGILGGDLANQFAYEIIANAKFPSEIKTRIFKSVTKYISLVVHGQIHDILLPQALSFSEEDVLMIDKYKTCAYTYQTPIFAGAIAAGVSDEKLVLLDEYCLPGGIAFQIRDDILGMYGESDKTGKSNLGDIKEGKKTLLIVKAYENGSEEQKTNLDMYLGKEDLTDSEADIVRTIVRETGSLEYSIKLCEKFVREAQEGLAKLNIEHNDGYDFLHGVAEYMIVREV